MNMETQSRINRWSLMASVDLGDDINPMASQFADFFGRCAQYEFQFSAGDLYEILPIVRGFGMTHPDTFSVVECIDLCYINILDNKEESVAMFEEWLMNNQGWKSQYEYAKKIS